MTWTWHRTLLAQITLQAVIAAYIAVTTLWGGSLAGRKSEVFGIYAEDYENWARSADRTNLYEAIGMTPAELAREALAQTQTTNKRDFMTFLGAMVLLSVSFMQFGLVRRNATRKHEMAPPKGD